MNTKIWIVGPELSNYLFLEVRMFTSNTGIIQSVSAGISGHIVHLNLVRNSNVNVVVRDNFDNEVFVRRENKINLWRKSSF